MILKDIDSFRKEHPYMCKYIEQYGSDNLPSTFEIPPRFKNNIDEFYKYCLEQGKEWNEIIKVPKNVIL